MNIIPVVIPGDFLHRIRRNHALEHATLQVLAQKKPSYRLAGYSDLRGFWIVGDVDIEALGEAATEALRRLQAGESALAIHPHCGTNYVASGLITATLAWLVMAGGGKGWRSKLDRWPLLVSVVTMAMIFTQPLGPILQARVTTDANVGGLRVVEVVNKTQGDRPLFHVLIHHD